MHDRNLTELDGHEAPYPGAPKRPVDLNVMKRNMTIAKGFLDISLLSANANQLRNIINFGDTESPIYYVVISGIIFSLVIQIVAGIILIVAERFDINQEEDDEWSDRLNTTVVCLVFIVVIVNVFISSMGVDVANPSLHKVPHLDAGTKQITDHNQST